MSDVKDISGYYLTFHKIGEKETLLPVLCYAPSIGAARSASVDIAQEVAGAGVKVEPFKVALCGEPNIELATPWKQKEGRLSGHFENGGEVFVTFDEGSCFSKLKYTVQYVGNNIVRFIREEDGTSNMFTVFEEDREHITDFLMWEIMKHEDVRVIAKLQEAS